MQEDDPAPGTSSLPSNPPPPTPAEDTNLRRVTRSAAFRDAAQSTPRIINKARRRLKETWKTGDTPELHWDAYQTFASESSDGSTETNQIILSPNRTIFEPVFESGSATRGFNGYLQYSPATPLSNILENSGLTPLRRASYSGLRTVSASDIQGIVSNILFHGRQGRTTPAASLSGIYSELERDAIIVPRRQLSLDYEPPKEDTMADALDQCRAHRILVREAVIAYREFDDFDTEGLSDTYLKETTATCEKYKKSLLESCAILEDSDATYQAPLSTKADEALKGFARTIYNCQRRIFELESRRTEINHQNEAERTRITAEATVAAATAAAAIPPPQAPPPVQTPAQLFKAKKVADYEIDTVAGLTALYGEFMSLVQNKPTSEKEAKKAEERLSALNKRAETAVKEGRSLAQDAAESNLLPSAEVLEKEVRRVNTARDEAISQLSEVKVDLGVIGAGASLRSEDLEPPVFSGDLEQMDYYTWAKDLEDYFQAKNLSNAQQVSVVKRSCLKGVPATACLELTSLEEIQKFLKSYYGNAGLMLDAKIRDFRKLGKCIGGAQKRRDWIIRAKQKLEAIHKLALKHDIQNHLYYSSLMSEIHTSLTPEAQKGFRELMDSMNVSVFDKEEMFIHTLEYLGDLEQKANFQMNFEITLGAGKLDDKTQSKPAQNNGKKVHTMRRRIVSDLSEDESCSSAEEEETQTTPVHIQANYTTPQERQCNACKKKHEYLFYCEKFQSTRVKDRFRITRAARVCMRCLRMDSRVDFNDRQAWFKEHDKNCQTEWQCVAADCEKREKDKQFHFLMCSRHIAANKERIGDFEKKLDKSLVKPSAKFLYSQPRVYSLDEIAVPEVPRHPEGTVIIEDISSPAIFLMQNYTTKEGKELPIMFDSGCSAAAISEKARNCLETQVLRPGPTEMGVAGGKTILIKGGDERFWLESTTPDELYSITGLCMPEITTPFPIYPLTAAFEDLQRSYRQDNPEGRPLPLVPKHIGGSSVAIMMGIRYIKYFPKLLYHLPCGLGIYEAQFKTPDGNLGVLGGPHKSWSDVYKSSQIMSPVIFFTQEMKAYHQECVTLRHIIKDFQHWEKSADFDSCLFTSADGSGSSADEAEESRDQVVCSVPERNTCHHTVTESGQMVESVAESPQFSFIQGDDEQCVNKHCEKHGEGGEWIIPAHWDISSRLYTVKGELEKYLELENCGSELTYRCIKCRNCADCRKSECLEKSSLQEEKQQALLESCVNLDVENKTLYATLPFILDPAKNLTPNKNLATKILDSQLRRLAKKPDLIPDVLRAHNKLRDKGHVLPIKDLPREAQQAMAASEWDGYYLPWSTVCKETSLTTPARQVFNASARTPGGLSLNQVLAKGQNLLPKIFQVLTNFRSKKDGFIGDISMAYNSIKLTKEYYCFQKYLWREGCDPSAELMEFVIITLIYGVICSGGMMQAGIEKLADHAIEFFKEHEDGAHVLKKAVYVDDVAQPADSPEESRRLANSVEFTLDLGSMGVKAFTFVGSPPSDKVSADGRSVGVLGYTWWPVEDELSIAIKPLFFGKMKRGKTPSSVTGNVREALKGSFDRRTITGKAASVFDPLGLTTPITARFKMNLSEIVNLRLGWDDPIPDKYLDVWINNLDDMQRVKDLRFPRCFLHPNAISNQIKLIVSVDASENICVAAVHAVCELPEKKFHCRLMAAKSKLVSLCTIPRAELRGAVLGATLAHVIKRTLGNQVEKTIFVTDSSVVLFWMNQDQRPLQTAVRNGVIEIRRLTNLEDWRHVASADNVADIGTRHVEVSDILSDSAWVMGHPWMSGPEEDMPLKTVDEVLMNQQEKQMAKVEIKAVDVCGIALQSLTGKLADRYSFSRYVVDPCVMSWPKSVRILAFVKKFIRILKVKVSARRASEASTDPPAPRRSTRNKSPRVSVNFLVNSAGPENFVHENIAGPNPEIIDPRCPTEIFEPRPNNLSEKLQANTSRHYQISNLDAVLAGQIKDWQLEDEEIKDAENYFFRKATKEVKQFSKLTDYKDCTTLKDGILYYNSRVLDGQELDDVENIMSDLSPLTFCNPMLDRWSPVAYSIMVYSHQRLARHRNEVATLRESRKIAFVIKGRDLSNQIREVCIFCRRFKAKLVEVEMGKVHSARLTISPAFFRVQADLFGPLTALCNHNHRARVPVWGCIFKDPASGAISVHAMEKYDTGAFLSAFARHSYRYGYPARLYIDAGSQLVKACKDMEMSWADITSTLNSEYSVGIEYEVCAVGRHDRHGMVERSVQDVKKLFYQVFKRVTMDLFAYETGFAFIANELNSLPICLGSKYEGLGHTDLITASRLLMGRNNRRAPLGYPRIVSKSRQIDHLDQLHKAWWKVWKNEKILDYIPSPPKWHSNTRPPKEEDIVVYLEKDKDVTLGDTLWRLGRVVEVIESEGDRKVRSLKIEYKNATEDVFRTTYRSARKVAILFREGELELADILNEAARAADQLFIKHMRTPGGPPAGYTIGSPEI